MNCESYTEIFIALKVSKPALKFKIKKIEIKKLWKIEIEKNFEISKSIQIYIKIFTFFIFCPHSYSKFWYPAGYWIAGY